MVTAEHVRSLDRESLIEKLLEALEKIKALEAEIAELKRARHRQSAPFSKGKRKQTPSKPGRRAGQGRFTNRGKPESDRPAEDVEVSHSGCPEPGCDGKLEADGYEEVSTQDVPPAPKPQTRVYRMQFCKCGKCGRRIRARHPEVPHDQTGSTAHRLGPRVKALALGLHYGIGVPMRRVPRIVQAMTGIRLTQSAITQCALKEASQGTAKTLYEDLRGQVRHSSRVFTDDTGWSVGGETAYTMGFETDTESVFQIRPRHRNEEVREVIPADYKGTVHCDRGSSYEANELSEVRQQKCHSHIERNLKEAMEKQPPQARVIGRELRRLLKSARELHAKHRAGQINRRTFDRQGRRIDLEVTWLLRDRKVSDPENQKIIDGIGLQHDRGHLLRFLSDPTADTTNNQAERMLRDMVIGRKVSQGSKTWNGANACATFKSIYRTLVRRGIDAVEGLTDVLNGINPLAASDSS